MARPKKKPSQKYRKNPSQFPASLRWQVEDVDYLHKLSPEELEWYLRFREAEYGGNGQYLYKKKEVRRLWRENAKQKVDVMNTAAFGVPIENRLVSPSPEDALIDAVDAERRNTERTREERVKLREERRKAIQRRLGKK